MTAPIETHFRNVYRDHFLLDAQQTKNHLADFFMKEQLTGKVTLIDTYGSATWTQRTSANAENNQQNLSRGRRAIAATDWEWTETFDWRQERQLARKLEPNSTYDKAIQAGRARRIEQVILDAIDGTAYTGETGTTAETWANSGGTDIARTTNTEISVANLRSALATLHGNGADMENLAIICGVHSYYALQALETFTSQDYVLHMPYMTGKLPSIMGCRIIVTPQQTQHDTTDHYNYVYVCDSSAVIWGQNKEVRVELDELPGKGHGWQFAAYTDVGATRVEGERIVRIEVDEDG